MSHTAEELLIIYETEADEWATYLQSVFTGLITKDGICCYDIASVSNRQDDFLKLARYTCKLLILSKGILEGLCQMKRFFLARVLSPAAHVVVLLCGVESLTPLLELVPLNGDECLQISSEQDPHEYLSAVTDIVRKGVSTAGASINPVTPKSPGSEQKPDKMASTGAHSVRPGFVVVPSRVPCGSFTEVFILLRDDATSRDSEVEFTDDNQMMRVKPVRWNDRTLCVNAPDFPAGIVSVTVHTDGGPLSKAQLQYYSNVEEVTRLLSRVADPVDFMCQALQVSSVDKLDQKLSSMLSEAMPSGGFQGLQCEHTPERAELHHADVPSLLHFAALYGLKGVSSLLLQCPGAERAMHTANRRGQTPTDVAKSHCHAELHVLLKETLDALKSGENNSDASVYEMMCTAGNPSTSDAQEGEDEGEEEEDPYAPLGVTDEYDTILTSRKAVASRPPAPTPRPAKDGTPYITQVFPKKTTPQGDASIYSLPTKPARGPEDAASSTYDTFVPNRTQGQLAEALQRVQAVASSAGEALQNPSDRKGVEKDVQQGGLSYSASESKRTGNRRMSHLRAAAVTNTVDDDGVYDKINLIHHTPNAAVKESGSQPVEFYSKPLKGQHSIFFWKADKR